VFADQCDSLISCLCAPVEFVVDLVEPNDDTGHSMSLEPLVSDGRVLSDSVVLYSFRWYMRVRALVPARLL
jgi:hypothetical protein